VPTQTQCTHVQRLTPKNKEVSPYISLQAGYRSKRQGLTHIWLHVTLLATTLPVLHDLFYVLIFISLSFISLLCHPFPLLHC
jgi:hypothetical protein